MKVSEFWILHLLFALPTLGYASSLANSRIPELLKLSGQIKKAGPNCAGSALYAAGLIDDFSFVNVDALAPLFGNSACHEVKAQDRAAGDLAVVYGERFRYQDYVPHVALLATRDQAFSKMGYEDKSASRVIQVAPLKTNPGTYLSKACLTTLTDSAKSAECMEDTAAARYFRCDIAGFRVRLAQNDTFNELLAIRAQLLHAKPTDIAALRTRIHAQEGAIIARQKRDFPSRPIADRSDAASIDRFVTGFRIETYLFSEMNAVEPGFSELLFEAALTVSARTQCDLLEGIEK